MKNFKILKTAIFNAGEGSYSPAKRFNLHERINFRGQPNPFNTHICNTSPNQKDVSHNARKERYEESSLEKGVCPFGYPEDLYRQFLRGIAHEDHSERCEAKSDHFWERLQEESDFEDANY